MLGQLARKIFGSKNERTLKQLKPLVEKINALEPSLKKLSDGEMQAKTAEFKERFSKGETLDSLLPEAFAVVREAAARTLQQRHFDAQLIGGICLHNGKIAEMKTGEGKTLAATAPVYLNALSGQGVHVVTVNDYLAKRDANWMGAIYKFLGLSVGFIVHGLNDQERRVSYASDVTYGTNNEFGFDYLRDNMKYRLEDFAQRELNYAIVDEVDSILIDEARTPLIISGPAEQSTDKYYSINGIIPHLKKETHFNIDEKMRVATLTEEGVATVEKLLRVENLYDPRNIDFVHHVNKALVAHGLYKRDVDYVVKDGQVIIVDEFTGRLMPGRRYSDGLHQALEAKEGVKIESENQTLATITFQNYFRMYKKLAGMTGTADTEAEEFQKIYNLEVVVIPTNKNMIRTDHDDLIYKTEKEKFKAAINEIKELHQEGRPVLVGTISIEKSEILSEMLKRQGIKHNVLNAKHHEKEAQIVAQAGQPFAVTISTNMAGRGTDIVLGEGVALKGGLHILGTERHESRRIDNQLRGRSGRQGDPGSSRFYLSLQDDLLRIFGGDRIAKVMDTLRIEEGQEIQSRLVSRAIENAQRKVEARNFDIRKNLLEYDNVMNTQREVIYHLRKQILKGENQRETIEDMIHELVEDLVELHLSAGDIDNELKQALEEAYTAQFGHAPHILWDEATGAASPDLRKKVIAYCFDKTLEVYKTKESLYGVPVMRRLEQIILLDIIDTQWKDHLLSIDHLKEGIHLRGYAQRDPLLEYKKEAFNLFKEMDFRIKSESVERLFKIQLARPEETDVSATPSFRPLPSPAGLPTERAQRRVFLSHGTAPAAPSSEGREPIKRDNPKLGRNDPCHCGSGKKFKKCHGQ